MISVTAAAHSLRRSSGSSSSSIHNRPIGSHLKAYGSGRVAMSLTSIDEELKEEERKYPSVLLHYYSSDSIFGDAQFYKSSSIMDGMLFVLRITFKVWDLIIGMLSQIFPFVHSLLVPMKRKRRNDQENTGCYPASKFEKISDKVLKLIFQHLDAASVLRVKATCRRFHRITNECSELLPKFATDQIKLYFDEGEVIIYPLDEKAVPTRHDMPPLEKLEASLKHLSALSLFVRGLIPIESAPVLRRLDRLRLNASQIFFLWCDFDPGAEKYLLSLLKSNLPHLKDIGFEVCNPPSLISDHLIKANLPYITSLRIWHESGGGPYLKSAANEAGSSVDYAITDRTLMEIAGLYSMGISNLETVDLANCAHCSLAGVVALIEAWYRHVACPSSHLSLSLHQCGGGGGDGRRLQRNDVISRCNALGIPLTTRGLQRNGFNFSMYIT